MNHSETVLMILLEWFLGIFVVAYIYIYMHTSNVKCSALLVVGVLSYNSKACVDVRFSVQNVSVSVNFRWKILIFRFIIISQTTRSHAHNTQYTAYISYPFHVSVSAIFYVSHCWSPIVFPLDILLHFLHTYHVRYPTCIHVWLNWPFWHKCYQNLACISYDIIGCFNRCLLTGYPTYCDSIDGFCFTFHF